MDRLTDVGTRIECYQNFLEDLEEITSALETNSGLGCFLQYYAEQALADVTVSACINRHEALPKIKYGTNEEDYIKVLLVLWARANAKIGEIAFLLENSIEQLQNEEDDILADMEHKAHQFENDCYESANRQKNKFASAYGVMLTADDTHVPVKINDKSDVTEIGQDLERGIKWISLHV